MSSDIVTNRKAFRDYTIEEKLEAGIVLTGTEIKSVRQGFAAVMGAFARIEKGEAILYGVDIKPYDKASHENHKAKRPRKLLLHRREIDHLFGAVTVKGRTLVLLRLYWKRGRVKAELGIGKGKVAADKRQDLKKRTELREVEREMAHANRKGRGR